MSVKKILELIEAVNPEYEKDLDEIDARVWCYFQRNLEYFSNSTHWLCPGALIVKSKQIKTNEEYDAGYLHVDSNVPRYTRSRDALKTIRPAGWLPRMFPCGLINDNFRGTYNFCLEQYGKGYKNYTCFGNGLPTEELAELHAIIQAIEWERNNES